MKLASKITISLVMLAAVVLACLCFQLRTPAPTPEEKSLRIMVVDATGNTVIDETVTFHEEASVFEVLKANFADRLRYDESAYGAFLYDFGPVTTNGWDTYLAVYVGEEYASVGISYLVPEDGMTVVFKYEVFQ